MYIRDETPNLNKQGDKHRQSYHEVVMKEAIAASIKPLISVDMNIVSCLVELKTSSSAEDAQQWWGEIFGIKNEIKPLLFFIFLMLN